MTTATELQEAVGAGELYIKTDGCNYPHMPKNHVRTLIQAATAAEKLAGALRAFQSVKSNGGVTQKEAEKLANDALANYENGGNK